MDDMQLIIKIQRSLQDRLQQIGNAILTGGDEQQEKYKYQIGERIELQIK